MTVCIAAACERGTKAVIATDRLLSLGGITSDNLPGKMLWIDDWLVLYAGAPSNTAMIIAALREGAKAKLTSENVRQSFKAAYQLRKARLSSFAALSSYDLTLEAFKKEGRTIFGDAEFRRISKEIADTGQYFNEQLLVVGWGGTPHAIILYEVGSTGDADHNLTGMAAIGTGSEVAKSTMMLLGQARHSSLTETLYTVAAAKFSSEKSETEDVGKKTSMCIIWKREEKDDEHKPPVIFLTEEEVSTIYALWEKYGKPRISEEVFVPMAAMLKSRNLSWQPSMKEIAAMLRQSGVQTSEPEP